MKTTQHLLISGRVQGVGFRQFVQKRAKELGLEGWVRNLRDGRVEAMVFGEEKNLSQFSEFISEGPPAAQVSGVERFEVKGENKFSGFEVIEDGSFNA